MKFSKILIASASSTVFACQRIEDAIVGRWELIASENVSEYIDNENGPMLYTAFGKRMTPDVEYVKLEDNSYIAKIHLSVMPQPMKIPMRLDGEYEHKNPTSEYVKSVPEIVEGREIVLHTKGGSEGPVEQRLQIVDDKLIHTMSMLDKDITAVRTYARKIENSDKQI